MRQCLIIEVLAIVAERSVRGVVELSDPWNTEEHPP
jgi:hypothetical protein